MIAQAQLEGSGGALDLMERVLRGGDSLAPEYPLVFREEFPGRVVALGEESGVRSACAILTRDFLVDGTRVRGGLIGSVATDPDWRDRGLATRILVEAEAALQKDGCAFALLWAEDPDFYLKRGYGPIGTEDDFVLPTELAVELPIPRQAAIRELEEGDAAAVHRLYERHAVRIERTAAETEALLACPEMRTLVVERYGSPAAYACLGRGRDLADAIHEWSGDADDVLALIRAHLELRFPDGASGNLFLMAPPAATELGYRLTTLGVPSARGMLGLGKILDRGAARALLAERIGEAGSVELLEGEDERPFHVRGPDLDGRLDDQGCLALLFGVTDVRADVRALLEDLGLGEVQLPIEPFAWGLDSI